MSSCWRSQEFPVLHYRLSFLQCDWRRDISLQKVIKLMKPEVSAGCHQTLSLVGGVWGRDYLLWDRRLSMCSKVWKVREGGQSVCTTLKEFWGRECGFEPHRTWGYGSQDDHTLLILASIGTAALSRSYSSFLMRTSRCCGCIILRSCSPVHFRARLLALPHSHHNFFANLLSRQWDR